MHFHGSCEQPTHPCTSFHSCFASLAGEREIGPQNPQAQKASLGYVSSLRLRERVQKLIVFSRGEIDRITEDISHPFFVFSNPA